MNQYDPHYWREHPAVRTAEAGGQEEMNLLTDEDKCRLFGVESCSAIGPSDPGNALRSQALKELTELILAERERCERIARECSLPDGSGCRGEVPCGCHLIADKIGSNLVL